MGSAVKIALVSLDQVWLDKDANYLRCREFVYKAATHGCELVIFPEMTLTGYSLDMEKVVESMGDPATLRRFELLAQEAKVNVIFGASFVDADS